MNVIIIIIIGILFASFGQILWKVGMNEIGVVSEISVEGITHIVLNPYIFGGLFSYGIGTLFWLIALSRAELSFVYPFIALTFVIIFMASFFLFHENISFQRILGALIIVIGIVVLVKG
jgi:uncharacterized membrane protein